MSPSKIEHVWRLFFHDGMDEAVQQGHDLRVLLEILLLVGFDAVLLDRDRIKEPTTHTHQRTHRAILFSDRFIDGVRKRRTTTVVTTTTLQTKSNQPPTDSFR